jgi:uncharacterized protein with HEPN domain
MRLEANKYLHDIRGACLLLVEFTAGITFEEYRSSSMLRSAVERQFEILGEALNRLSKCAPEVAEQVHDRRRIIGFRNILIHGYADVDDRLVWGVVEKNLKPLIAEVDALISAS